MRSETIVLLLRLTQRTFMLHCNTPIRQAKGLKQTRTYA